jgi:tight adherence protein B
MNALAILCACGAAVVWFAARARLGVRVRKLAGVRLRITDRMSASLSRASATRALVGLLAGIVLGGSTLGVAGIAAGLAAEPLLRSRAVRAEARALERQLPDALRAIASALRAGRSLPQALAAARDEAPHPIRRPLHAAVRRLDVGAPLDDALDAFAAAARADSASLAAETIRIGRAAGANLPNILDVAAASLDERARIALDRRAATSQARMSAMVIGGMPIAFFAMVGGGAQRDVLLRDPVGWVLIAGGAALDAAGILWMRALTRTR